MPGRQSLLKHDMSLSAPGTEIREINDYFGNAVHEVRLHSRHEKLAIESECEVDVTSGDEILLDLSPAWDSVAAMLAKPQTRELWHAAQFCRNNF